jgi:hydroxypyruvate isomerase
MSGQVAPEQQTEGEKVFIANLTRAADLAGERGITILVEPINRRDRPGYLLHRPEQAAAIIAEVGRPNVRMQFDFYHVQIEGGDLMTRFTRHHAVIGHVQVAAVPSRAEPDEGEVNYPAILDMLDRSDYPGFVGCEYRPRRRTEDGLGWARRYGIGVA